MDDPRSAAMGEVGLNLATALFMILIDRQIITATVAHDLIDHLLTGFETATADDATTHEARRLVEALGETLPPRAPDGKTG